MIRKLLVVSIFTLLLACLSFGQEKDGDWTYLQGGQKFFGVEYRTDGTVMYANDILLVCPIDPENKVTISTPSKIKGFSIVHCLQTSGESSAFVIDTKKKKTLTEDIVPKRWRIDSWFSWSPNENYVVIAARGEVTNGDTFFVDIKIGRTTVIQLKDFTNKNQSEAQDFSADTFSWINSTSYKLRLDVFCNIYELGDQCNQERVLRSYNVKVNVATLAVTYVTPKTLTSQTSTQKKTNPKKTTSIKKAEIVKYQYKVIPIPNKAFPSIRHINFKNFTYLVSSAFFDKPVQVKAVKGKYLKGSKRSYDFWEFTVDKVIYGDLTGDTQEEALVITSVEQSGANPANSFDEGYYIYTLENGKPQLLGSITRSDIWNAYIPYENTNDECDGWVWGTKGNIKNQKLVIELFVGGRQCVENGYDVTMTYSWNGSEFTLEGKPIKKRSISK